MEGQIGQDGNGRTYGLEETLEHVLLSCTKYRQERLVLPRNRAVLDMRDILQMSSEDKGLKEVFRFLEGTGVRTG